MAEPIGFRRRLEGRSGFEVAEDLGRPASELSQMRERELGELRRARAPSDLPQRFVDRRQELAVQDGRRQTDAQSLEADGWSKAENKAVHRVGQPDVVLTGDGKVQIPAREVLDAAQTERLGVLLGVTDTSSAHLEVALREDSQNKLRAQEVNFVLGAGSLALTRNPERVAVSKEVFWMAEAKASLRAGSHEEARGLEPFTLASPAHAAIGADATERLRSMSTFRGFSDQPAQVVVELDWSDRLHDWCAQHVYFQVGDRRVELQNRELEFDLEAAELQEVFDALGPTPPTLDLRRHEADFADFGAHTTHRHGPEVPLEGDLGRTLRDRVETGQGWEDEGGIVSASMRWIDDAAMNRSINGFLRENWNEVRLELAISGYCHRLVQAERLIGEGFYDGNLKNYGLKLQGEDRLDLPYQRTDAPRIRYCRSDLAVIRLQLDDGPPARFYVKTAHPLAIRVLE